MLFVYGMYARLFYCLWHMRNQFTIYSELQPYLTGPNHSYTRQVKCPLIGDLIVVLYVVCTHEKLIVCRVLDAQSDEQWYMNKENQYR